MRGFMVDAAASAKQMGAIDLALRYNPLLRGRVVRVADAFERADRQGRRTLAERMTARALAVAGRTRYGSGREARLDAWPIVPKQMLRDDIKAFCRRSLPAIPAATSGTTGMPLRLVRSLTCVAAEQVYLDRLVRGHGLDWRSARIAVLRADTVCDPRAAAPPYGILTHGGRRLVLSSPHLSARTLSWYVDALDRFKPDLLWVYPTMAASLLRLAEAAGAGLRVTLVLASSESLDPRLRAAMETGWGATVIDYYGLAERVAFAAGAAAGQHRFDPSYGRVELLEVRDGAPADGTREVAIVATGYWNAALPLVRYDTGDRALVPADATEADLEAIALGLAPFAGIAGRSDDFVHAPDGRRLNGMNHLPREVDNLLQLQIVQEAPDSIVLHALVRPGFGPADAARLIANARAKLPAAMAVRVAVVDRLEQAASGKTPFVIRRHDAGCARPA
jgi:phenylacetate-CoA ligase